MTYEATDESLSCSGLVPGQLQLRRGLLCSVDEHGRSYYRAPRRADVALAKRVVAAVANDPKGPQLLADVTAIRERP